MPELGLAPRTANGRERKLSVMNSHRHRLLRQVRARPRLFISTILALIVGLALPDSLVSHSITRWLVAWNAGTLLYIVLAAAMMIRSSDRHMRQRALLQDEGSLVILVLVVVAGVASLAAIAGQLAVAKDMHGWIRAAHIALAGTTVVSSWTFIQVMFALHYAHDYYAASARGLQPGLRFPDEEQPTYGDFFYFAAVIGTSGQTADVSFVSKLMRRVGSAHCILAYVFNTTVLALLINIAASLF